MIELPSLFPHQEDLRDRTRAALAKHGRVILTAPPGMGKTRTAKWILGAAANRKRKDNQSGKSLFTVHRRGLVQNATDSFHEEPRLPHGVIMSGVQSKMSHRTQVASIDTLLSWFVDGGKYDSNITFDLIIWDECVSGDSIIQTELGQIRIDEVPLMRPQFVLSKCDKFQRIMGWKSSGTRNTIVIHTHVGKFECTPDHKVFTRRGWLEAQYISHTDEIAVSAGAGKNQGLATCFGGATKGTLPENSTNHFGEKCSLPRRCANADAANKCISPLKLSILGLVVSAFHCIGSITRGMLNATRTKCSLSIQKNGRQYLEPCLETVAFSTPTQDPVIQGSIVHTEIRNGGGLSTKPTSSVESDVKHESLAMMDGATCQQSRFLRACRVFQRFTISLIRQVKKLSQGNGSTVLETLASRGGLLTMGVGEKNAFSCTPRGFRTTKTTSSQNGLTITSEVPASSKTEERACGSSISTATPKSKSDGESCDTRHDSCGTNWSRVIRIEEGSLQEVFDIEVENTHCFFANGHLVHNCHSHHPKFARFLKHHDERRKLLGQHPAYVIGLTATPQAKGLADIYKEIVQGPSTGWLIENGFLSPFRYFRATTGQLDKLRKSSTGDFTKDSEAAAMDGLAGDLVRDWKRYAEGRPTVGFFPRRSHAQEAMEQLRAAGLRVDYVDGETSDESRKRIFWELNEHRLDYVCNVQVIERGTDIPRIGCVQLCVAIGSLVRYLQMVGRGSRIHPEKTDCLVLDHGGNVQRHGFFEDEQQWTLDVTTKDPGEAGTRPTIECPNCSAIYRGGKCRSCGYEPTPKERKSQGLEFDGSELKEVKPADKKKSVKTAHDLMVSCLYRAGKSGRTWKQAVGMFYGDSKKQGTNYRVPKTVTVAGQNYEMLRYGSLDGGRRVADLFPFTR